MQDTPAPDDLLAAVAAFFLLDARIERNERMLLGKEPCTPSHIDQHLEGWAAILRACEIAKDHVRRSRVLALLRRLLVEHVLHPGTVPPIAPSGPALDGPALPGISYGRSFAPAAPPAKLQIDPAVVILSQCSEPSMAWMIPAVTTTATAK